MKHPDDEPLQECQPISTIDDSSPEVEESTPGVEGRKDWQLWPPSPKVQIVLIAMVFGLFNLLLLAIWALVMVYRF